MSEEVVLEIRNLTKSFEIPNSDDYPVLKGIDLLMKKGDFFALMGPSGSGKSTLLNIVGALIRPSSGDIIINGKRLSEMSDNELTDIRRNQVGWIFQDFNLVDNLTAIENVLIPMNLAGKFSEEMETVAINLLKQVDMGDRLNHFPDDLSGGQQQRVAIARALANDAQIILADEPTGNLDTKTGKEIIDLFKNLSQNGKVVLMVSHDVALAHAAQKVFILRNGKIEEEHGKEVI